MKGFAAMAGSWNDSKGMNGSSWAVTISVGHKNLVDDAKGASLAIVFGRIAIAEGRRGYGFVPFSQG
jgi:hypothetical protein